MHVFVGLRIRGCYVLSVGPVVVADPVIAGADGVLAVTVVVAVMEVLAAFGLGAFAAEQAARLEPQSTGKAALVDLVRLLAGAPGLSPRPTVLNTPISIVSFTETPGPFLA